VILPNFIGQNLIFQNLTLSAIEKDKNTDENFIASLKFGFFQIQSGLLSQ